MVGGRPCSSGGGFHLSKAVRAVYGPVTLEESAERIVAAAAAVPADQPLVLMAHCGPSGSVRSRQSLRSGLEDPSCGLGGSGLALALDRIARTRVPDLVIFGHMHHQLKRGSGLRTSLLRNRRGTAFVNAACVPRSGVNDQGETLLHWSWAEPSGSVSPP